MKELKIIAKGGVLGLIGDLLRVLISYIFLLIASNILDASRIGAYYWVSAIMLLAIHASTIGIEQGINYFIPRHEKKYGQNSSILLLAHILVLSGLLAVILGGALFITAPFIVNYFHKEYALLLFRIFALAVPLFVLWSLINRYLIARYNMKISVLFNDILKPILRLIALITLAFISVKYYVLIGSDIVAGVLILVVGALFLVRSYGFSAMKQTKSTTRLSEVIIYSLPFLMLILMKVDRIVMILLGYFLGLKEIGIFTIALKIAVINNYFINGINSLFAPMTAALIASQKLDLLQINYRAITRWIFIGSLPMFFFVLFYPGSILGLFGPEFVSGAGVLMILACGFFFNFATSLTSTVINMSGQTWLNLANVISRLGLSVLLIIIFVPRFGLVGAALSLTSGIIFINIVRLYQSFKIVGFLPYSLYLFKPIVSFLISGLITVMIFPVTGMYQFQFLVLIGILYSLIYIVVLLLLKLNQEDMLLLQLAKRKYGARLRAAFQRK